MAVVPRVRGLKMRWNVLVKVTCDSPPKGREGFVKRSLLGLCGEIAALLNGKLYFPPKATVIHFYRSALPVHHTKRGFE